MLGINFLASKAFLLTLLISIFVDTCNSFPLDTRQLQGESWSLYVYGANINGLPVYYADGIAKIGYASKDGAAVCRNVFFKCSADSTSTWLAQVNETQPDLATTTRSIDATAANFGASTTDPTSMVLYMTNTGETCSPIGFANPADTKGKNVNAFYQHGYDVLLRQQDASFYAKPGPNGSYTLMWSAQRDNGNIPVLVKTIGLWPQPVITSIGKI